MTITYGAATGAAVACLRQATRERHERLERRLDAAAQLADPQRRPRFLARYAALHLPAEAALAPFLADMPDLAFEARSRARRPGSGARPMEAGFPQPGTEAEALGMLYVLEGSLLGGRVILRAVAEAGGDTDQLGFLAPYGEETGRQWRSFLQVLERSLQEEAQVEQACLGAQRAFDHAERVLCGATA